MVLTPILLAQILPLGPPHVGRLSGVSGFDRNMFVFSRLRHVFFSRNAGMTPFRPRRMCPRLPMGPHMIPRMHKRFNRLPALPSLCLRGCMSWCCLTERHCPAVCPGLGRRHQSWRGGTHHAVWFGVSYRVLVLLF